MARPRKDGIDYFSFDTDFFSDKKIRVLKSRFGADGMMIYIYILCEVYKNGYYIKLDDDYEYIIADDLGMSSAKVKQVLKFLLERSLLDSTLFQSDTIITSHGIQKRFQEAVRKRASITPIEVDGNIWLLKEEETQPFIKVTPKPSFWGRNPSFCNRNPSSCGRNDAKESKVNESIVEDIYNTSTELPAAASEQQQPSPISLPLNDGTLYPIWQSSIDKWTELYPAVDVMQELRMMKGWLDANRRLRKTKSGIMVFVVNWLAKAQNRGGAGRGGNSAQNGAQNKNSFNNFAQGNYDMDSLEDSIVSN